MAAKQMTYTGRGIQVVLPDSGEVRDLSHGDVVGYDEFGGDAFFDGRGDFKVKAASHRKAKAPAGGSSDG